MPIIIDVPLLFETGMDKIFNKIIVVYSDRETQINRLMKRDNIDRETAIKTIETQIDIKEKTSKNYMLVDNSGTFENTEIQVQKIFERLVTGDIK